MLKTVCFSENVTVHNGTVMLLGGFDGLHAGHKMLVARAKSHGLPIGIMTIVGGKDETSLFTLRERERIFRKAGIDFAFELPFEEIRELSAHTFVGLLNGSFHPKFFVCGDDFRFGQGAKGTPQTLERDGQVCVETEELLRFNGEKISSSAIKSCLKSGEIEKANLLLGEPFFVLGEVFKDRGVGTTIGFPTANVLYPKEKIAPKLGVYETRVLVCGKEYKGVSNYGDRPTFSENGVCLETHLLGFNGDLYGKKIEVRFVRRLRGVQKFESVDVLKAQLNEDIRRVAESD